MNHDPETIRRLVAEVIARVTAPVAPPVASAPTGGSTYGQPQAASGVAVADKVVTLAALERLPAGTARIVVAATAVVTPSAREHARDMGITIERATNGGGQPAAASLPFVVAHAECGGDPAARARCR